MSRWRIGDWIDERYEVFDVHLGGMGIVYVVYDHKGLPGQRVLALKTLRPRYLGSSRAIGRFVSECRTWIQLDRHPNIVRAHAVQIIADQPYVALELVTGGSLRDWIGSARLDLPQVLRFGVHFCLGMEHAARKGMQCHRDIKPENLLTTEGGTLKITDFGLAKIADWASPYGTSGSPIPLADLIPHTGPALETEPAWVEPFGSEELECQRLVPKDEGLPEGDVTADWPRPPAPASGHADTAVCAAVSEPANIEIEQGHQVQAATEDGALLGTGLYMAPEQFRAPRSVNLLADQYSFGIVLFEMITSRPPFRTSSPLRLARLHANERPSSLQASVPSRYSRVARRLDRVVQRCLEKAPTARFSSFGELRSALAGLLHELTGEVLAMPSELELVAWDLNSKGVSLAALGRLDEERESYETALHVKPTFVPAWFNLAAAAGSEGHMHEAIRYAELALRLNPRSVPALINKALALHALKRPAEAVHCLDSALHLAPRDPDAWRGRVAVLWGMGNTEGARVALDQVRRLRPGQYPLGGGLSTLQTARENSNRRGTLPWARRTEDTPA